MAMLRLKNCTSMELEKNKLTHFFDQDYKTKGQINYEQENRLELLTYLSLNSNACSEIPQICKHLGRLQQLHMHMNRVSNVRELCRSAFAKLEVLDLSGNRLSEIPVAFVYFLGGLTSCYLANNDLLGLPSWIGFHKTLNTLTIDGNPMKQIRRQVTEKGTATILAYLRDKFVQGKDDQVE
jgi:Leucine-rich repeat (LRR) protein